MVSSNLPKNQPIFLTDFCPMKLGQLGFLGDLKTSKFYSEINWPLTILNTSERFLKRGKLTFYSRAHLSLKSNNKASDLKVVTRKISNLKTTIIFCFQNCSDLLFKIFANSWPSASNLFEQWKVRIIFETGCFFNLFLEVFQIYYVHWNNCNSN